MLRPPSRLMGLVVQDGGGRLSLPRFPLEGGSVPTPRSSGGSRRIGPTSEIKRLSWTRESQDLKFSRAISGQSAASAAHLPCREGCTFPHPAWAHHPGAPSVRSASHRGGFRPAQIRRGYRSAGQPHRHEPGTPAGGKRRGSGRVWASDKPRPLRDREPLPVAGPSTYGGRDFLEGGQFPDQALECQEFHGCWRGRPPTILMRLSKNRSD